MQFGLFLYKQGAISAEEFVAGLEYQQQHLVPLGQLAQEQGKLSRGDLLRVLRVQSDLPQDRFGRIAIELGLISQADFAELLMVQSNRRIPFGQCLVELGILDLEQVEQELVAYRRSMERGGVKPVGPPPTTLHNSPAASTHASSSSSKA